MRRRVGSLAFGLVTGLGALLGWPHAGEGQVLPVPPSTMTVPAEAETLQGPLSTPAHSVSDSDGVSAFFQDDPVSPGRAFLRSLVVPGWGHAAAGSYTRGGSYFLLQGTTAWMLYKSAEKRASARQERDLHLSMAESRLRAEGIEDPDSLRILAEQDDRVEEYEELVETRGEQVEDWAALGIFLMLMGAADAFVSAHLQDFPEPLDHVEVDPWLSGVHGSGSLPSPRGAVGIDIGLRLPLGGGPSRR